MSKQPLYDAIKSIREGNTINVEVNGIPYCIEPWLNESQNADGCCQTVLCKYLGNKIGVKVINWHDAGPNPRLVNYQNYF